MAIILILLIILWFFGYITIPGFVIPTFPIFYLNGYPVTLWNIFIFALILWAIGIVPSPFREIFIIIVILWLLSTLGIIAIAGFSSILVIALIIGLILALIGI